jgi:hypothetical protein
MHYANKYVELLDTVFIVLRKKTQQLSYLHMYHHVRRSSSQSTWCLKRELTVAFLSLSSVTALDSLELAICLPHALLR